MMVAKFSLACQNFPVKWRVSVCPLSEKASSMTFASFAWLRKSYLVMDLFLGECRGDGMKSGLGLGLAIEEESVIGAHPWPFV